MYYRRRIRVFTDRYPLIGPIMWIGTVEYYIIQFIVALRYGGYSLRFNTISDLGNTACGQYGARAVCSPWHVLMNASFITLGLLMAAGALLIYHEFNRSIVSLAGFAAMALAGCGTIVVGLFPENTVAAFHVAGAALPFTLGNAALILLGASLPLPKWFRAVTCFAGGLALVALGFYMNRTYGILGQGGLERLVAYPQTIWLIVFGAYMSKNRWTSRPAKVRNENKLTT